MQWSCNVNSDDVDLGTKIKKKVVVGIGVLLVMMV